MLGLCLIIPMISLSGCIGNDDTQDIEEEEEEEVQIIRLKTTGATFPENQIKTWIAKYKKINPNVKIKYYGRGSGRGQDAFLKGRTHIGRTDTPVKEDMWKRFKETGDQPLQFPEIVGAVVITYNIPEIGNYSLNISREVLADIFLGKIEYWDDEKIKSLNPGVADKLPHEKIIVVHRKDSSGTTKIFTTFLCMISKEWEENVGSGKLVRWPADDMERGIGGKGNSGVIDILKNTNYSIAYTELSYTIENKLPVAAIENKKGNYIIPKDETIKEAVSSVKSNIPNPEEGYKEDTKKLLDAPSDNAYPIVVFTHFLVWENKNNKHYSKEEAKAIKDFLTWVLTEGQKPENLAPGYVGLPKDVTEIGLKAVKSIKE